VWLARGRDAEARALIDSARAAAETMGMRPMLTLASSLSAA
jgi:hypothetical protein